ncbi:unnamed protein product [Rotaria sordida]|uniref:Uncharacterized protein n=1 Tax=Rotaria sordida TaxID=392033 RepID=A0A814EXP2_9BILA|nr:unnamed protein product [Rotaria sordida]CAF0824552.1 unnamed protein product [Rotaria sordida]CAF0878120.1 unnamed protein product [Rotaria sordida]CAF0972194.1 unnamed protein product [Rotaria sordida]CAF1030943.1 unnamed protein product [Rotaria sordida]
MKNQLCSYEELQSEARIILDDIIRKYSIRYEHQNGLTDYHPMMGILIMPLGATDFGKDFMFVSNLPNKNASVYWNWWSS